MATTEPRNPSLGGRLLAGLIGPLAALFLISGATSYGLAQYFADAVYDGWLFDSVSSLALEIDQTASGPVVDMPPQTQRLFEWDVTDNTYFNISGARRGLIVGRANLPEPDDDTDIDEYQGALLYNARMDGQNVRVAVLELPETDYGEKVRVKVAETTRKRRGLAQVILLSTLIPQLVLIAVAALAIRRGIRHGLHPLRLIADRLESRSHRQLAPLADEGVPREVQPLTRALNELLARLEGALASQRRFIAEAAHQLRTPLTAIKLQADEIRREGEATSLLPLLDALRASADRAARLSNQLLSLARAEPDGAGLSAFRRFDLLRLVEEAGAEWVPRAVARGLDIRFTSESDRQPIWIDGDPDLLREALNNLFDNALKYHPGKGAIHLRLASSPTPSVAVEDDGPGIPAEQRAQMLRRFVRGSRGEGSGLGLPIALEIARLHGGDLLLEDAQTGSGLSARLILPLAVPGSGTLPPG
jgi:two-component system sensor histidine kinase TctE